MTIHAGSTNAHPRSLAPPLSLAQRLPTFSVRAGGLRPKYATRKKEPTGAGVLDGNDKRACAWGSAFHLKRRRRGMPPAAGLFSAKPRAAALHMRADDGGCGGAMAPRSAAGADGAGGIPPAAALFCPACADPASVSAASAVPHSPAASRGSRAARAADDAERGGAKSAHAGPQARPGSGLAPNLELGTRRRGRPSSPWRAPRSARASGPTGFAGPWTRALRFEISATNLLCLLLPVVSGMRR